MMRFITAQANRLGNRKKNQDRLAIVEKNESVLLIVADGLGGHPGGERAAQQTVDVFCQLFNAANLPLEDPQGFLRDALLQAHQNVILDGKVQIPPISPRTTGVVCIMQQGLATWLNVGDSRLYLFRDHKAIARTLDHSLVEELVQKGLLTEKERNSHPKRHHVTRCIGGYEDFSDIKATQYNLEIGDVLILCSDGLWDPLGEEGIAEFLNREDFSTAIESMAAEAENKSYPYSDNTSVVALRLLQSETINPEDGDASHFLGMTSMTTEMHQKNSSPISLDQAILDIKMAINAYKKELTNKNP